MDNDNNDLLFPCPINEDMLCENANTCDGKHCSIEVFDDDILDIERE